MADIDTLRNLVNNSIAQFSADKAKKPLLTWKSIADGIVYHINGLHEAGVISEDYIPGDIGNDCIGLFTAAGFPELAEEFNQMNGNDCFETWPLDPLNIV